jgi:site-specific DNA recombinase
LKKAVTTTSCPMLILRLGSPSRRVLWPDRRKYQKVVMDPTATAETIAKREACTARKVNMTISFAFLAPDLVKAAIDGTLPQGMGVVRLADLPAEWSKQHQMLGLPWS